MSAIHARTEAPTSARLAIRATGRLRASLAAPRELDRRSREAMWELFTRYYTDVERSAFDADLDEKDHVILLRDEGDGSIRGMSTLKVYDLTVGGRKVRAVFSGDTIIDAAYWGQSALHWAFLGYLVRVKLTSPLKPVFWFLISKGYKTYLLLARNFPTHYPRHDRSTPRWEQAVLDALSRGRYGDAYDAESGLLRFAKAHGRLCDRVAPITADLLERPDIRFFVEKNPRHAEGDELCCIGRVDFDFVLYGALRVIKRPMRRRLGP